MRWGRLETTNSDGRVSLKVGATLVWGTFCIVQPRVRSIQGQTKRRCFVGCELLTAKLQVIRMSIPTALAMG